MNTARKQWQPRVADAVKSGVPNAVLIANLDDVVRWVSDKPGDTTAALDAAFRERNISLDVARRKALRLIARMLFTPDANPWHALGLRETATAKEARERYKRLTQVFHPDKGHGDAAWLNECVEHIRRAHQETRNPASRRPKPTAAPSTPSRPPHPGRTEKQSKRTSREANQTSSVKRAPPLITPGKARKFLGDASVVKRRVILVVTLCCLGYSALVVFAMLSEKQHDGTNSKLTKPDENIQLSRADNDTDKRLPESLRSETVAVGKADDVSRSEGITDTDVLVRVSSLVGSAPQFSDNAPSPLPSPTPSETAKDSASASAAVANLPASDNVASSTVEPPGSPAKAIRNRQDAGVDSSAITVVQQQPTEAPMAEALAAPDAGNAPLPPGFDQAVSDPADASAVSALHGYDRVRLLLSDFTQFYVVGNLDGFVALYTSNASERGRTGRRKIRAIYKSFFDATERRYLTINIGAVYDQDDTIVAEGNMIKSIQQKDGQVVNDEFAVRFRMKNVGGSLKIASLSY